ncbi:MAG: DUF1579 domain-containing protein [Gemmataceae bacterium]|nr:DUF1579 domain-containing protein [Gemmataceae bacterium]
MSVRILAAVAGLAVLLGYVAADDKKKAGEPDMQAMMAAMMKHATPGEHHKVYEQMVGKWTYTGKATMGNETAELTGKSERKLLMDGRFMHDHVVGDATMPFEGIGISGYDNHTKKYFYVWFDSMSTSMMRGEGDYDSRTKTLTMNAEGYEAAAGAVIKMKDVLTMKSADEIEHTFYKLVNGKEVKTMELHYKRAK